MVTRVIAFFQFPESLHACKVGWVWPEMGLRTWDQKEPQGLLPSKGSHRENPQTPDKQRTAGQDGQSRNFPGSPVAWTPHSQRRGPGSIPGQGTRSPMPQLKILCASMKITDSECCY